MPKSGKEYHLLDLLTGESLGGFASLTGAREEARAAGLTRWDIFQGNVRIERHDPGIVDPILDDTDLLLTIDISLASDRCHTPASSAPSRRKSKGPSLASTGSRHDPTHSRAHFQLIGRLEPRQIATDEVDEKPTSSLDMPGKKKPRRSEA